MLYSITSGNRISNIAHGQDYAAWRRGLSDDEHRKILMELDSLIEGTEIQTSTWIPVNDWSDTVFHPIWERACGRNETASAKFSGLLVWETFIRRPDWWAFGRYELDGVPIEGLTYLRIDPLF
jgi:hypothetical protein